MIPAPLSLAIASLRLDAALARSRHLPRITRLRLLAGKYAAIPALLRGRHAHLPVGGIRMHLRTLSDLGTLQSAIVDAHDTLVPAGVLSAEGRLRVVDIGANIGQFAAAVLLFAPRARLTCFEPDPETFARLGTNLGGTNALLHNAGLLDRQGRQFLHRHRLTVMSSFRQPGTVDDGTLSGGGSDTSDGYIVGRVEVPVTTLDAVLPDDDPIDLVKIDVEGAEWDVLAGATRTLRRTRFLLVEVSLDRPTTHTNLHLLQRICRLRPAARIVRLGRPLGPAASPVCQDVLIDMGASPVLGSGEQPHLAAPSARVRNTPNRRPLERHTR
jgi:FkbM family methyltransferase